MATTRKAVAKAEERRISQIGDFKNRMGGILELPSGLVIKWRNPGGLRVFMAGGKIPNALLPIVDQALKGGKGVEDDATQEMIAKLQDDPQMIAQMMDMYDDVAIKCFVEPRLYRVPDQNDLDAWNLKNDDDLEDPEELRRDDRLYVDEIPDDDKAYLFQLLSGGVRDLDRFRQERQIDVDHLARVSGVIGTTVGETGTDQG
jgi:hypothetical protein